MNGYSIGAVVAIVIMSLCVLSIWALWIGVVIMAIQTWWNPLMWMLVIGVWFAARWMATDAIQAVKKYDRSTKSDD